MVAIFEWAYVFIFYFIYHHNKNQRRELLEKLHTISKYQKEIRNKVY